MEHGDVTESAGRSSLWICFISLLFVWFLDYCLWFLHSVSLHCSIFIFSYSFGLLKKITNILAKICSRFMRLGYWPTCHWQQFVGVRLPAGDEGDQSRTGLPGLDWTIQYCQHVSNSKRGERQTDGHGSPPHESLMNSSLFHSLVSQCIFYSLKINLVAFPVIFTADTDTLWVLGTDFSICSVQGFQVSLFYFIGTSETKKSVRNTDIVEFTRQHTIKTCKHEFYITCHL